MAMAVEVPKRIQPSRARRSVAASAGGGDAAVLSAFAPDDRLVARVLPVVLTDDPTVGARAEPLPPAAARAYLAAAEGSSPSQASSTIPVPDCGVYDPGRVPRPRSGGAPDPAAAADDTSDAAFERRHFKLERTEKRLRRQEIDRVRADRALLASRIEQMRDTPLDALVPSLEARKDHEQHALVLFGLSTPDPSNPSTPSASAAAPNGLEARDHATTEELAKLKDDMLRQAEHALERHDALLAVPPPVMGKTAEEEAGPDRKRMRAAAGITREARAQRIRVALAAPRAGNTSRAPAHVARAQRAVASVRSAARKRELQRQRVQMTGRTLLGQQYNSTGQVDLIYQEQGAHNIHARTSGGRFASKPKPGAMAGAVTGAIQAGSTSAAPDPAPRPARAPARKKASTTGKQTVAAKASATSTKGKGTSKGKAASSVSRAPRALTVNLSAAQLRRAQARAEAHAAAVEANPTPDPIRAAAEAAAAKAALKAAELRARAETLGQRRTAAATAAAAARAALKRELGLKPGQPIPPDLLAARLQEVRAAVSAASAATQPGMLAMGKAKSLSTPSKAASKKTAGRSSAAGKSPASASRSRPRTSNARTATLRQTNRVTYNEDTDSDEDADGEDDSSPTQEHGLEPASDTQLGPRTTAAGRPVRAAARKSHPETATTTRKAKARASLPATRTSTTPPARGTRRTRLSEPAPAPGPELGPDSAPAPTLPTRRVKITLRRNNQVKEGTPVTATEGSGSTTPVTVKTEATTVPAQASSAPFSDLTAASEPVPAQAPAPAPKRGRTSQPAYIPSALTEDEAMAMLQAALADDPDALDMLGGVGADAGQSSTRASAPSHAAPGNPQPRSEGGAATCPTPQSGAHAVEPGTAGAKPNTSAPQYEMPQPASVGAGATGPTSHQTDNFGDEDADGEADAEGSADEGWIPMEE